MNLEAKRNVSSVRAHSTVIQLVKSVKHLEGEQDVKRDAGFSVPLLFFGVGSEWKDNTVHP